MSENKKSQNSNEGKGGSKNLIIILCILICVLIAVLVGIIVYANRSKEPEIVPEPETGIRSVIITDNNSDELISDMASNTPSKPGYYTVAMTTEWHFENSSAVSYDALVKNKTENTNNVYFDLFLADDMDNPIYRSPVISLGAELDQIKLDVELPQGEYECVMIYHLVDENQNTLDTVQFAQKVIIEN